MENDQVITSASDQNLDRLLKTATRFGIPSESTSFPINNLRLLFMMVVSTFNQNEEHLHSLNQQLLELKRITALYKENDLLSRNPQERLTAINSIIDNSQFSHSSFRNLLILFFTNDFVLA